MGSATVKKDPKTGEPRGFGFVMMQSGDYDGAIEKLHQTDFMGSLISVQRVCGRLAPWVSVLVYGYGSCRVAAHIILGLSLCVGSSKSLSNADAGLLCGEKT